MELVNGRQLDLFELLATFKAEAKPLRAKVKAPSVEVVGPMEEEGTIDDYLSKGERIESLARDAFLKVFECLSVSELEQKIFSKPWNAAGSLNDNVVSIAKVVRSFISDIHYNDEDEKYKILKNLIDFDFDIREVDIKSEGYPGAIKRLRYNGKRSSDIVAICIREEGFSPLVAYCYRTLNAGNKSLLYKDGSRYGDLAIILTWLFVLTLYNRAIKDEGMYGILAEKFRAMEGKGYDSMGFVIRRESGVSAIKTSSGVNLTCEESFRSPLVRNRFRLPFKEYMRPRPEVLDEVRSLFGLQDVDIPATTQKKSSVRERNGEEYRDSKGMKVYQYVIPYDIEYAIVSLDPLSYFKRGFGAVQYNRILDRATHLDREGCDVAPICWPMPSKNSIGIEYDLLKTVIGACWEEKGQVIRKYKYYREMEDGLKKSCAKAYQTKKNIPQKVLKEMEESVFNEYFGYVEFDETCDLDKVRVVAEEFIKFKKEVMPGFDSSNVALRFRKLGKHKASGLYYPMFGCLCVDLRSPSSFVHEYGHCLDHVMSPGRLALSDKEDFYKTYSLYATALKRAVTGNKDVAAKLSGGSKYNLDYYLLKTEAFARCFELYVVETLGIDISLAKPSEDDMGFAYPKDDEELMKSIEGYFDALLATVNGVQEARGTEPLCA